MSNILFVFEGEKTEKQISNSLSKCFFDKNSTLITCVFCGEIYQLQKSIENDKDLDTFTLLKERPQNKEILSKYNRDDFAEIYLFFDYDGHSSLASDNKLLELLSLFNEETNFGKLFISYPMVECIKHYSEQINFKELTVPAKQNIQYKQMVDSESEHRLKQFSKYTTNIWYKLIELHLSKMNYIINNEYSLPKTIYSQTEIFANQINKYIDISKTVSTLSAFPIFLFDYYGLPLLQKIRTHI